VFICSTSFGKVYPVIVEDDNNQPGGTTPAPISADTRGLDRRVAGAHGFRASTPYPVAGPADEVLVHGYSLGEVNRLAYTAAARSVFQQSVPFSDRLDTAWSAIVEHLYSTTEAPRPGELIRMAWKAMQSQAEDEWRTHGISRAGVIGGDPTMPNFWRYWWAQTRAVPSPEERIVERLAIAQIWRTLTPGQRRLLLALAVHDDYGQAAASLDKTRGSFTTQLSRARQGFLDWWHQGEKPSGVWGRDRRRSGRSTRPRYVTSTRRRTTKRRTTTAASDATSGAE
jgi:hypothetical protein